MVSMLARMAMARTRRAGGAPGLFWLTALAGAPAAGSATFSSVAIGAASSAREIVLLVASDTGFTGTPTATVNSISATLNVESPNVSFNAAFIVSVPTATTATIVIGNVNATAAGVVVGVWSINRTLMTGTINAIGVSAGSWGGPPSVNIPTGGAAAGMSEEHESVSNLVHSIAGPVWIEQAENYQAPINGAFFDAHTVGTNDVASVWAGGSQSSGVILVFS